VSLAQGIDFNNTRQSNLTRAPPTPPVIRQEQCGTATERKGETTYVPEKLQPSVHLDARRWVLRYYDIHGFSIAVCDEFAGTFEKEYGHLRITSLIEADLIVRRSLRNLDIKWPGTGIGLSIPFGDDERDVLVNSGVSSDFVFFSIQPLVQWKDKCLLHSSAAWKDENAYLFPGASGVGKTTMLLFLLQRGFNFLSDNFVTVGEGKAYPYRKTIHLYERNIAHGLVLKNVLGRKLLFYRTVFSLIHAARKLVHSRMLNFALDILTPNFIVDVEEAFPGKLAQAPISVGGIFLLERGDELDARCISPRELSQKAMLDFVYNYRQFFAEYYKWAEVHGVSRNIENIVAEVDRYLKVRLLEPRAIASLSPV
jgi:hypothetical protein